MSIAALAVLGIGATELMALHTDRTRMQDVADGAALSGARELSLGRTAGVTDRAEQLALSQLTDLSARGTVSAEAGISDTDAALWVRIDSHRQSFFGSMLPPGGFKVAVVGRAGHSGAEPLCVLALSEVNGKVVTIQDTAKLSAAKCRVHANDDLETEGSSSISAGSVHVVDQVRGVVHPTPVTGVPPKDDPLASRGVPVPTCRSKVDVVIKQNRTLRAGLHCGGIQIEEQAVVTLEPGVHYFREGALQVKADSRLQGSDVALVFAATSKFQFQDRSTIDLTGSQSGALSGIVIHATPDNTSDFEILSSNVRRLEGTIYMPAARLTVIGDSSVSSEADWTITVTRQLLVKGSATFVINTDYHLSPVPVPAGLGASAGEVRLTGSTAGQ